MSPFWLPHLMPTPRDILDRVLPLSLLTSATFVAFHPISPLWHTTSLPPNPIYSSSLKLSCLRLLTANLTLFPPTIFILIFEPKVDVVCMCATT